MEVKRKVILNFMYQTDSLTINIVIFWSNSKKEWNISVYENGKND